MEMMRTPQFKRTLKLFRLFFLLGLIFSIFIMLGLIGLLTYAKVEGPPPLTVPQSTIYYGQDGSIIGESHNGQKRYWVSLSEVSPTVIEATISIEDKKFFQHNGFDYSRIAAAAFADLKAMAKVQGASTITQQYARNLFLSHDKTWERKLNEALFTIRLEMNYSKKKILEGYLNTIYYGHGVYGIEAASNYYFHKKAKDLTLSEATILAGIPKGPSIYSPISNPKRAKKRQRIVLNAMVANGYVSSKDAIAAYQERVVIQTKSSRPKALAPYFQDAVNQALQTEVNIDERLIEMGGLHIYTTLNPTLQQIAERKMKQTIDRKSKIQAALVAIEPETGAVRALIGGRDYDESPFNRAIQAERMPGSTFKPFLYYSAIESGFTPATRMRSEPTSFRFDEGRSIYHPSNYNDYYADDFITLAQAIALSDNVYAVKTNMFLGPEQLVETAKRFGISSGLSPVPSLALGTSTVKVIDMVNAYGMIANGGKETSPFFIEKITDHNGNIIFEKSHKSKQVLDEDAAFVTAHLMTGMFDKKLNDYTSVTGTAIANKLTRLYAGKSGTTQTDSWMIGFSPTLTTGVWVGYDRDEKIDKVAERKYAKEIWAAFMEESLKSEPIQAFLPSKGVVAKYVNPDNGKLATVACPINRLTYFVKGTEPQEYCTDHMPNQIPNQQRQAEPEHDKGWIKKFFDWLS